MDYPINRYYKSKANRNLRTSILLSAIPGILLVLAGYFLTENSRQATFLYIVGLIIALISYAVLTKQSRKWLKVLNEGLPARYKKLLEEHVAFYRKLDDPEKIYFEQRVQYFLKTKQITAVNCDIDDKIRLFIAASAVLPVFSFPDFFYRNVKEILVYPDSFDHEYNFSTREEKKRIAGMVGNGVMSRMMILSKKDLLRAFDDTIDADNLAIHEFVHLIDMADGAVDGIPKAIMDQQYTIPWISEIHREMHRIRRHQSDIDAYSLTNNAEFLAVISEYFFDTPEKFKDRHPGLYKLLSQIFKHNN